MLDFYKIRSLRLWKSIKYRLWFYVWITTSLFTVVFTSIDILSQFHLEKNTMLDNVQLIESRSLPLLQESMWDLDYDLARIQLNGLSKSSSFSQITLYDSRGDTIFQKSPIFEKDIHMRSFNIVNDGQPIGRLEVQPNIAGLKNRFLKKALKIFFIQSIKAFFLSFALLSIFSKIVTNPILRISNFLSRLEPEKISESYYIGARPDFIDDEITHLENNINSNIKKIKSFHDRITQKNIALENEKIKAEAASNAKSNFLATMGHELRTPLNAILGYVKLISIDAKKQPTENLQNDLNEISNAAKHLLSLIESVLDLSKLEVGEMQVDCSDFDLKEEIQTITEMIRPLAIENNNKFLVKNLLSPLLIRTDRIKLRQIILNLLSNAFKFTENGIVEISIDHRDKQVFISVKDTGIGIENDQINHIFAAFSQVDSTIARKFGGSGLGLSISKKFSTMLGGQISVQSSPGKGSVFTLQLSLIHFTKSSVAA